MTIEELKSLIKNDLLFILDNRCLCVISVSDEDINNVYSLLESAKRGSEISIIHIRETLER